jgi:hypothetical protein
MTIPNQDPKKCTQCGEWKPRVEFYFRSNGWISGECKVCRKARTRKRYYSDRHDEIRTRDNMLTRIKRQRIKDAVFAAYGGYKCACCGETEKLFLTLDHINNDGAKHRRKISGNRTMAGAPFYAWLLRNNFPNDIQVLCMNCQHGKRMNKGICPHRVRCNDQSKDVGLSSPKRIAPQLKLVGGEDMVCSISKDIAVLKKTG